MANIQLAPKKSFPDVINASFLFIEYITPGSGVYARIIYENGQGEDQEIVPGSKFVQSLSGQKIWKVEFINPSDTVTADIIYRFSTVFGYDEARIKGDVNALTRFDNVSLDGDKFLGGLEHSRAGGYYAGVAWINEIGSGVRVSINRLKVSCAAGWFKMFKGNFTAGLPATILDSTFGGSVPRRSNKVIGGALPKMKPWKYEDVTFSSWPLTDWIANLPADTNGTPVNLDFKSEPIILNPGYGIVIENDSVAAINSYAEWSEEVI